MGTVEFVTGIISFGGDKFSGELTIGGCGPIFAAGFRSSSLISSKRKKIPMIDKIYCINIHMKSLIFYLVKVAMNYYQLVYLLPFFQVQLI